MTDHEERPTSDWLPPGAAKPKPTSKLGYGTGEWIAAAALGVLLLVGYQACSGRSSPPAQSSSRSPSGTSNTHGAWAYMQQFVIERLKAPSSADFPFGGHRSVSPLGDGRYLVKSYVDSQNSFGAQIRTNFEGVVRQTPTGWQLEYLKFDGEG